MDFPIVFISYSWDNICHKEWVKKLADKLVADGFSVFFDSYDLRPGKDMIHYMEQSVDCAHKVLIIMTPNYKQKADKRKGGVGYETSIVTSSIYKEQDTDKFIPILRGNSEISIPLFLQSRLYLDMCDDSLFEKKYEELKSVLLKDYYSFEVDDLSAYDNYQGGPIPSIEILKYRLSKKATIAQENYRFLEVIQLKLKLAEICIRQDKSNDVYMLEEGIRKMYMQLTSQEKYKAKKFINDYNKDMALYIDQDILRYK